jgi:uncharacterized membrane protein YfcA
MLQLCLLGFICTLILNSFMSMGGVGGAFILVPIFFWLGLPFPQAAATGLMLGILNTGAATASYAKDGLVNVKMAIPLILTIFIFSPMGVYSSNMVDKRVLLAVFAVFLMLAGSMMLFYHPQKASETEPVKSKPLASIGVGGVVGFLSGLLGIGGGAFLGPFLAWSGMDGKRVAGTSAFVVMFSSLIGFLGHIGLEYHHLNFIFMLITGVASLLGGIIGSWLTRFKLTGKQVKQVIGIFQYLVALKIILDFSLH